MTDEIVSISKEQMRGKCWTCRRGVFTFGVVWCIHPTRVEGYKLHGPLDTCQGWELTWEFSQLKKFFRMHKDGKPIKEEEVEVNGISSK